MNIKEEDVGYSSPEFATVHYMSYRFYGGCAGRRDPRATIDEGSEADRARGTVAAGIGQTTARAAIRDAGRLARRTAF